MMSPLAIIDSDRSEGVDSLWYQHPSEDDYFPDFGEEMETGIQSVASVRQHHSRI